MIPREEMFERARARDRASDGRFLMGVVTTGIYCLPSCPARKPRRENTRFFESEDDARAAGLRPCKRCRPDHFYRDHDPDLEAVEALARDVLREPAAFEDVRAMAAAAGTGKTKLSALFREHFHESPALFLTRARVDHAARLLADTDASALEVSLAVGFESASAFHENFRRHQLVRPGEYKKLVAGGAFALRLPDDWRAEETLAYLGRDAESETERRRGARLAKACVLDGRPAVLEIELARGSARCSVDSGHAPSPAALRRAHRTCLDLLGLRQDPAPFERRLRKLSGMARLVRGRTGLRVPLTADAWESLVWSIVGQQVNLAFATTLRRRLIALASRRGRNGMKPHPTPAQVARLEARDLKPLQFSQRKAEYVIDLARAVHAGELPLDDLARGSATRAERTLLAQRGLGPWSANYVMMRGLGFADCLPLGDAGLVASLQEFFALPTRPGPEETRERMQPFRPWRSLACLHFWKRLGEPGERS